MERKTFIFHKDWFDSLDGFESEIKLKVIGAIVEYALYGIVPTDKTILYSPFAMIRKLIDIDNDKYQAMCLRNKEKGKLGGRPRKENQTFFSETQKTQVVFEKPNESQQKPKNPSGFLENPKNLDTDTDTDTDTELILEPKGSLSSDKPDDEKKKKKDDECEYIHNIYNEAAARSNLKKSVKLTDSRKSLIKARLVEYDMRTIIDVINKAAESPWLNGDNDRGWRAGVDFVFNKSKFIKILEGSYNNAKPTYNRSIATSGYASPEDIERQQRTKEFMQHIIGKIGDNQPSGYDPIW